MAAPHRLRPLAVFRDTFVIYRRTARVLLPIALAMAALPATAELLVAHELSDFWSSVLTTAIDNLATVVFAGAAEELVHRWVEGQREIRLRPVLAGVPPVFLPLLAVGLIQGAGIAIGLLLLIVPGLVALTWWSVVGPVVVAERPGIRAAFRRSRALVQGNGRRVLAVMLGVELLAVLIAAAATGAVDLFTSALPEDVSLAIGEAVTLPLEGLAVPVMYWRLRAIEDERGSGQASGPRSSAQRANTW